MPSQFFISKATLGDITRLVPLINSAYRGEEAKLGWTHEADLIAGTVRTDAADLEGIILDPRSVILIGEDENDAFVACVYLQIRGKQLYLGMFSVSPRLQGKGIGKLLLDAAEAHALEVGCESIIMNVIPLRHELIAWYNRRGYTDTGVRTPFPPGNEFGTPRQPLEFMVMEKVLRK